VQFVRIGSKLVAQIGSLGSQFSVLVTGYSDGCWCWVLILGYLMAGV
jgi:hypothetical protein